MSLYKSLIHLKNLSLNPKAVKVSNMYDLDTLSKAFS